MAGHSHWKNIKRKKEAADRKKSQLYTKAAHKIIAALRKGDANPETNYELKVALEYAKQVRMPKDNTERLIKKYKEGGSADSYQVVMYEVLGPSKAPMLIKVLTDNPNRTLTELRTVLRKKGGKLVEKGALMWQFTPKGKLTVLVGDKNKVEDVTLQVLDLIDVEDIQGTTGEQLVIIVDRDNLGSSAAKLMEAGFKVTEAEIDYEYVGAPVPNLDTDALQQVVEELKESIPDIVEIWTVSSVDTD